MAILIETPEQEIQLMIGKLMWDNTAQRHRIEALESEMEAARRPQDGSPKDHSSPIIVP